MYDRLFQPPDSSFFLFGPRGTGKTSLLKNQFKNSVYFDLLDSSWFDQFLARPQSLEYEIGKHANKWVILDEVQKVPQLLNEVHRLIESKKIKFILTGSSARSLRKKGVNLLAGRALWTQLHPLTYPELKKDFSLEHALKYGMLPQTYNIEKPEDYLNSYMRTYIREEVQQESLVRNLAGFSRFLEAASFSQAQILNISAVASECHVNRSVVTDYFNILEDLLISFRLPVFNKRAKRELLLSEKFFYFDNGVYRKIRPKGPLDSNEELDGASLETLLLQELRALNDYLKLEYQFYFWRTKKNQEVDFILYGPKGLLAIEVKRSHRLKEENYSALQLFKKDYPMAKCFYVYGGTKVQNYKDISIVPYEDFFKNLKPLLINT